MRAVTKFVRISPQKVRKVITAVKGDSVDDALARLKFMPHKAARILSKTISSAVANAENNPNVNADVDDLFVANIVADQGPSLKRFRARARGRGARILKRTSHITVTLQEKAIKRG